MGGKWVSVVENQYYPLIEAQWHRELNGDVELNSLYQSNTKRFFFLCVNCNKPFQKAITSIVKSGGIILCTPCHRVTINAKIGKANAISNKKDVTSENNLERYCLDNELPHILEEWSENNATSPREHWPKDGTVVKWICPICKQEWRGKIANRIERQSQCPTCPKTSKRMLLTEHPLWEERLKDEWSYSDNEFKPWQLSIKYSSKVTWVCSKCHHIWKASVTNRTYGDRPRGCPECAKNLHVSKTEKQFRDDLMERMSSGTHVIFNDRNLLGNHREVDIYFPDLAIAIEFNGDYYHSEKMLRTRVKDFDRRFGSSQEYHRAKARDCAAKGVLLLHVWEVQYGNNKEWILEEILKVVESGVVAEILLRLK